MVVLRRKAGETLVIAGTITVQVLAIEGARIKVGITAPSETPIVRGELLTTCTAHIAASVASTESSVPSLEPPNAAPRRSPRPRRQERPL